MKKASALLTAVLLSVCSAGSALAGDINLNDGDSIKVASATGLFGSMRFIAKEVPVNWYVEIPLNEGHVQLTFRIRGTNGIASFTRTFDGATIPEVIYVAPGHDWLSKVYIDRTTPRILRIYNPYVPGARLLVTGYILAM